MISVNQLSMRFGGKILFKETDLQLNPGHHYGLVGANGCGKSTFIKILTGDLTPESGNVNVPSQVTVGSLKQNHYLYENETILNVVLRGKPKLWNALEQKNRLLHQEHFEDKDSHVLVELEKNIAENEGYTAASEAAKLLEGLGIRDEWHQRHLHVLSGGYKLRVLLAQVFFSQPDVLLLDEPTNHLDLYSIKWLESYLRNFPGTLLVSSHDRHFLNVICTHIADVDYGTIKIYKGDFDTFMTLKTQEREQKEIVLAKQDKRRADVQGFIDRFKAKASKARQAQSKARFVEKLTEEMEAIDLTPTSRLYPKINFVPFRASGIKPLTIQGIHKSFGPKKVLTNVCFELERNDRLAIIGPNGIGKSTLLEILTQHLKADQGQFEWGFATKVAYFPQDHGREVQGSLSLIDWLSQFDRTIPQEQLREVLARVLFSGDTVNQSISTLSGGETARLILAKMMLQKPNILIFDEPTNHLDMEAIEELTRALKAFDGTLIFVSHNRYFVSELATRILELTAEGVKDFKCNFEEYLEKQETDHLSKQISLKQRYSQDEKKEGTDNSSYEDQKRLRNLKTQLKKKVDQSELECHRIEEKIKVIENQMGAEGFYQNTARELQQKLASEKNLLEEQLVIALEKWEAAGLELQTIS